MKTAQDMLNLSHVIEDLVYARDLDKTQVFDIICQAILEAHSKKFPEHDLVVEMNEAGNYPQVFINTLVVNHTTETMGEISLRRAKAFDPNIQVDQHLKLPFEGKIGRSEVILAGRVIAEGLRRLTQSAIFHDYKDRIGALVSGTINKRERAGYTINLSEDVVAFLPHNLSGFNAQLSSGYQIRAIVKQVSQYVETGHQIILDRSDAQFVRCLFEAEIPELVEGKVEIVAIERVAGYKTKVLVGSKMKEIDPVGAFVGIKGSRIQPILREVNTGRILAENSRETKENIDLIAYSSNKEVLVRNSLKPAVISQVDVSADGMKAHVLVDPEQKGLAIGRGGANIMLASKITGIEIQVDELGADLDQDVFAQD